MKQYAIECAAAPKKMPLRSAGAARCGRLAAVVGVLLIKGLCVMGRHVARRRPGGALDWTVAPPPELSSLEKKFVCFDRRVSLLSTNIL